MISSHNSRIIHELWELPGGWDFLSHDNKSCPPGWQLSVGASTHHDQLDHLVEQLILGVNHVSAVDGGVGEVGVVGVTLEAHTGQSHLVVMVAEVGVDHPDAAVVASDAEADVLPVAGHLVERRVAAEVPLGDPLDVVDVALVAKEVCEILDGSRPSVLIADEEALSPEERVRRDSIEPDFGVLWADVPEDASHHLDDGLFGLAVVLHDAP